MAGGLTTYASQKALDHITGKAAWAKPTAYVGLFTVAPTDAGGGTEAAYTGYARVATAAADWNAASNAVPSVASNANALVFGACTGGNSAVVAFGLFDAATGGNLLGVGAASLAVSAGIVPQFAAGALQLTAD